MSRQVKILFVALLLGIALASASWLFLMPGARGITDAQARKRGYANAAQRQRAYDVFLRVASSLHITTDQATELQSELGDSHPAVRLKALMTLENIGARSKDLNERQQALNMILPVVEHPSADTRYAVTLVLTDFIGDSRAESALVNLTKDSDGKVRKGAESSLNVFRERERKLARPK